MRLGNSKIFFEWNNMRDVTIYRHEDGKAKVVPWSDRDNPTQEELHPEGARLIVYTPMPHDWYQMIKNRTEEEVNTILSRLIP